MLHASHKKKMLSLLVLFFYSIAGNCIAANAYEIIYAVNAGGDAFTDENNIHYIADPLQDKIGTASDFGKQLLTIGRCPEHDEYLYQTERYHTATFGYDIPIAGDGEYALVLKFSEVYFTAPNMKVFDVVLNGEHTIVEQLDIYQNVGKGVAHDEIVYFTVSRGRLYHKEEESEIRGGGRIRVEFVKGLRDNPKINAIVLFKGSASQLTAIPKLPPMEKKRDEQLGNSVGAGIENDDFMFGDQQQGNAQQRNRRQTAGQQTTADTLTSRKSRKTSGPKQQDPYALDDSTVMLPVFIAIGAFIPLLFCLCKL